jgi:hypothetical protein
MGKKVLVNKDLIYMMKSMNGVSEYIEKQKSPQKEICKKLRIVKLLKLVDKKAECGSCFN